MNKRIAFGFGALFSAIMAQTGNANALGAAGVWQYWDYPATNPYTYNVDEYVTVLATGPTRFYAHQFWFAGGDAAYIGIQDTPTGHQARFSVWNSPGGAIAGVGATCSAFSGEGSGWTCYMPYSWIVGRKYRLRIWETNSTTAGRVQWIGTVQDTVTGIDTTIGYIWNANGQGGVSSSVSWIEDWAATPSTCAAEVTASAVFTIPKLNAGSVTASIGASVTSTCGGHTSSIQPGRTLTQ